ncbi:MAG: lysoplasmalogenase [bacterium]|nr:lysoplasmalogenase [bacterium]
MNQTFVIGILIYYILAFIILEITSLSVRWKKYRLYAKTAASLGFVVMAFVSASVCTCQEYALCMRLGFLLCMIGDIQLAITGTNGIKQYMKQGLLSFLFGHILFITGMCKLGGFSPVSLLFPLFYVGLMCFLVKKLRISLGKMRYPVTAYSFFISFMFSTGLVTWLRMEHTPGMRLLLLGTVFFLISDTLLFFLYFYHGAKHRLQFSETLTYYLAQILLASSLFML